jgi:hypothetical protein
VEEPSVVETAEIKIAVLHLALGIKALEDKALFDRLEEFWISAYARGRADARSQSTPSVEAEHPPPPVRSWNPDVI